jgi:Ca2+-dependent lipid-binding protein
VTVRVVPADPSRRKDYEHVHRTATQYSTLFPSWNKTFTVEFDSPDDLLLLDVWDWDAGKKGPILS